MVYTSKKVINSSRNLNEIIIERLKNTFTANGRNNNLTNIFLLCACRFYVKMSSFALVTNDCALYEIMEMIIF